MAHIDLIFSFDTDEPDAYDESGLKDEALKLNNEVFTFYLGYQGWQARNVDERASVVDTKFAGEHIQAGEPFRLVAEFYGPDALAQAEAFVTTLPEVHTGRYGIDTMPGLES